MKRILPLLSLLVTLATALSWAQPAVMYTGQPGAIPTRSVPSVTSGTSIPSSCAGDAFFIKTDGTPGANLYICNGSTFDLYEGAGAASGGFSFIGVFGSLPDASMVTDGLALVTDGADATCAAGSGSTPCVLYDSGSAWAALPVTAHTHTMSEVTDAGDSATLDVGTSMGTVAAGDDARFPTSDEKAALAGTGTPAAGDPFVNDSDSRLTDARTPTAHTHTMSEVTDAGDSATLDVGTTAGTVAAGDDVRFGTATVDPDSIMGAIYCPATSMSGTAYECATSETSTLAAGHIYVLKTDVASTGAITLDVNGEGAESVVHVDGDEYVADELAAGALLPVIFDGTNFVPWGEVLSDLPGTLKFVDCPSGAVPEPAASGITNICLFEGAIFTRINGGSSTEIGGGGGGNTKVKYEVHFTTGAQSNGGTAYPSSLSAPTSGGAAIGSGGSNPYAASIAIFPDDATTSIAGQTWVPESWDGGTVTASIAFWNNSGYTPGQDVRWRIATGCVGSGEANNPTFNTPDAVNADVPGAAGTAAFAAFSSVTMTGCSAGEMLKLVFSREGGDGGDTATAVANITDIKLVFLVDLQ